MARVAALMNPYFEKETPQAVREMELEDWATALREYPQWAIQNASVWWKSEDNPNRRKRPLEGDIAERCRKEMDLVKAANLVLSKPIKKTSESMEPQVAPSEEEMEARREAAERIMAGAGYISRMRNAE